jgi:hypothetical protein
MMTKQILRKTQGHKNLLMNRNSRILILWSDFSKSLDYLLCPSLQVTGPPVTSVTLPDILSSIPAGTIILKMDIQGYECKVDKYFTAVIAAPCISK